jgi:hypothetical protein
VTCKYTITPKNGQSCQVDQAGDWFEIHAKILLAMGIEDLGPVKSEFEALRIAERARRMADSARQDAEKPRKKRK